MRFGSVFLFGPLVLAACASPTSEPVADDESDVTGACTGTACASIAGPSALARGGLAVVGTKLFWVSPSATLGSDGAPLDELRSCDLPACAAPTSQTLVDAKGAPLHIERASLKSAGAKVLFLARAPGAAMRLFLSDGQALQQVGPDMDWQHDGYSADESGVLVLSRDRRTDGWARSRFTACSFAAPTACAKVDDKAFNYTQNFTLTKTRAVIETGGSVPSFDRATLGDKRYESIATGFARSGFLALGEDVFSSEVTIRQRNGRVVHDMSVGGKAGSFIVQGVITGWTSDAATALYVGTVGEGDVFGIPRAGVVARYRPGNARSTTIAKEQEVAGVAVDASKVYWLDVTGENAAQERFGVIRFAKK